MEDEKKESLQKKTVKKTANNKKVTNKDKDVKKETSKKKTTVKKTIKKEGLPKDNVVLKEEIDKETVEFKEEPIVKKVSKQKKKETSSSFGTLEVSVLLIITCILSITSGLFLGNKFLGNKTNDEIPKELNEFITNYNYIIENYYGEINKKDIITGAIKGMVESLGDTHTSFLDESTNDTFNIQLQGSFEGVGVEIINTDDGITVLSVFDDSPASKADIKAGDIIVKFNEINVSNKQAVELTNIIRNNKGKFTLTVKRGDQDLVKEMSKGLIIIKSVNSKTYNQDNKKIGYLEVTLFAANTYQQFKSALQNLESQNIDGLIIDVRFNTGGHLSAVENMISLFLDSSHIIYQTESKEGIEKTYSRGSVTKKYPIVLLSNKDSASASEVLMGALRDEYGAKVVGVKSFGKGTVQQLNTLSTSDQYKITVKKWLTPKGNSIDKVGIAPDIIVEQDSEYFKDFDETKDVQLKRALEVFKKS